MKLFKINKKIIYLLILISFLIVFNGCTWWQNDQQNKASVSNSKINNSRVTNQEIKKETIKVAGFVLPKEISLFGGSTHFLTNENKEVIFSLESKVEDLSQFEDKKVKIKGILKKEKDDQQNSILSVITIEEDKEENEENSSIKVFKLFKKGVALTFPENWEKEIKKGIWYFFPQGSSPIIFVENFAVNSPLGLKTQELIKKATEITVAEKNAFRIVRGDKIDIFILKDDQFLVFHFEPQEDVVREKLIFLEVLTNLKWIEEMQEDVSRLGEEKKCGGIDKKICPYGFRCELESVDKDANGICIATEKNSLNEEENNNENNTEESDNINMQDNVEKQDLASLQTQESSQEEEIVCAQDVKKCPSGEFVSRDPLKNCDFSSCPLKEEEKNNQNSENLLDEQNKEYEDNVKILDNVDEQDDAEMQDDNVDRQDFASLQKSQEIETTKKVVYEPFDKYYNIVNKRFNFTVDVPENYFWQHFGKLSDSLSVTGFSDLEMESVDDALIFIKVKSGSKEEKEENEENDLLIINLPKDENTYFEISGKKQWNKILQHIASSIKIKE